MTWEHSIYQSDQPFNQKLFQSSYENRLIAWRDLRATAENSETFLKNVVNVYKSCPQTKTNTDYYKKDTWPTPWQLLEKNNYSFFDTVLGIAYTLKLTECFNQKKISIINVINKQQNKNNLKFYFVIQCQNIFLDVNNVDIFDEKTFDKTCIQQYTQLI
jgi:hypothetical protein